MTDHEEGSTVVLLAVVLKDDVDLAVDLLTILLRIGLQRSLGDIKEMK